MFSLPSVTLSGVLANLYVILHGHLHNSKFSLCELFIIGLIIQFLRIHQITGVFILLLNGPEFENKVSTCIAIVHFITVHLILLFE